MSTRFLLSYPNGWVLMCSNEGVVYVVDTENPRQPSKATFTFDTSGLPLCADHPLCGVADDDDDASSRAEMLVALGLSSGSCVCLQVMHAPVDPGARQRPSY
eukprot:NODE_7564_length_449_cov_62.167500_g6726_i0.p1 GENE.NODE_7564_length_449_cov_62.167500_g6726_i0~~NODE_7564_length_449_cov_62.167500_g6726_i0.p1  ORF type:complete len:102 (-),score=19.36 NODE_7564_length_449_cov_62.167500_g6726_i0:43-348(-)